LQLSCSSVAAQLQLSCARDPITGAPRAPHRARRCVTSQSSPAAQA
jgi:hypothetical protein